MHAHGHVIARIKKIFPITVNVSVTKECSLFSEIHVSIRDARGGL